MFCSFKFVLIMYLAVVYSNYTREWVVRVKGGFEAAEALANEHGYYYRGPVSFSFYFNS